MKINNIRMGAFGGTLCSLWASISFGDILHTVLTAALGTLISIGIGHLLKGCLRKKR